MPVTVWIGRLCEEFHCLPSEAWEEMRRHPDGWLETLIEARAYTRAKAVVDSAKKPEDIPREPIYGLVREIEFALVRENWRAEA